MADLATLAEFKAHLGGDAGSLPADAVLQMLLDGTEEDFERECGRASVPFVAAALARAEVRDGVGSDAIWLDYGITTLTSVTLGYDHSDPDETLTVADLIYAAGSRRIVRLNGWFGPFDAPRYVKITYDAAADLPTDVKLAVLDEATRRYRTRGSEEVKSETMGPYSVTYRDASVGHSGDSGWSRAIAKHTRVL
jgi:hypothetical protein